MNLSDVAERMKHFNAFYTYLKSSKDFEKLTVKDLLWKVYNQACTDCGITAVDISEEEVAKIIETETFINFISDCITNPQDAKKLPHNDYVKVTWDCTPEDRAKCIAFPDRCEDVCSAEKRTTLINLSMLCGIDSDKKETLDDKLLTEEEIDQLSKILS